MGTRIKSFLKREVILCVAFVLALISCFFVKPDIQFFSYIDYRTLSILLVLMLTMAGLQRLLVFRQIGEALVNRMHSIRGVALVLIALCFFSSMLITNDVALITFVPFTVITLTLAKRKDLFIIVIVLETVAANLGSMLTPLGNPQNLYLYSLSGMGLSSFILLMLPYSLVSLLLILAAAMLFVKKDAVEGTGISEYKRTKGDRLKIAMYVALFLLSLAVVARVLDFRIGLLIVVAMVLVFDRKIITKPDYSLLLTFVFLFIFIGNIKRIPELSEALRFLVGQNEVAVSVALSQGISNVPAAILCSGFTDRIDSLIVGTNLGGLGTLIASMASLISFKQYSSVEGADRKKYIGVFTVINVVFLIALSVLAVFLHP